LGKIGTDKGAGYWYDRIFQSMTSVSVFVMSNGFCHLSNEFANFIAQTKADAISDTISR